MKKWIKKKLACFLCIAFIMEVMQGLGGCQPPSQLVGAASVDDIAKGVNVQYHTQDEIRTYIANSGATVNDALTFAEDPVTVEPYSLGQLSEETLESAVAMVNQIRYIAGISAQVQLSDDYNELAQAASLTNYVNAVLTHYPQKPDGMPDSMYNLAQTGASSSNIAWASWASCSLNSTIVSSWMNDGDSSNIDRVGHRRWILNPAMGKTGFGAVSGRNGTYSAVYAFDSSNSAAQEYGVMWPAQNMPVEYFDTSYPWSISMGYTVDASDIQVTLTRESDGKRWTFSQASSDGDFYVNNDGYGQKGCIIFRPDEGIDKYSAGEVFKVEITGLAQEDVSYTVDFFGLASEPIETAAPTASPMPTLSPVPTEAPVLSPSPDVNPTETPVLSPSPDVSPTETPVLSPSPDVSPTEAPVLSPSPDVSPTETPALIPTPAVSSTPVPTIAPAEQPDQASNPTLEPSVTQSPDTSPDVENTNDIVNADSAKNVKKGDKVTNETTKAVYKVTGTGQSRTVEYTKSTKKNVTSVTIPASIEIQGRKYKVTSVGKGAFKNSTKLKTIKLGKNVETIGKQAFSGCTKLTGVTLGKNVTAIRANAFNKCSALSTVTIPSKVKKIGNKAFYQCSNLQYILVKTQKLTAKSVGNNAFGKGYAKIQVKTNKSKRKLYTKIFKAKGMSKNIVWL